MPWGVAAAAVAGVAGSAISGSEQSSAVSSGQNAALAQEKSAQQQTNALNNNYVNEGNNAIGVVSNLSGANGQQSQQIAQQAFQTDPGYQFDMTQGEKAVDSGAAARGLGTSGANIMGETQYAEGLADNAYGNYYNRLSGIAQMGQTAIGQDANVAQSAAQNGGQTIASGAQDQANITGNTTSSMTSALNSYLNNQTVQNALTSYASPTSTGWQGSGTSGSSALTIPNDGF